MDALTISAASGIRARMESLELLANNIANQATAGYKADQEAYSLYVAPEAWEDYRGGPEEPATLPVVERQWTDFSQGTLTPTGNSLDLALSGRGFFVVEGAAGPLYTRNGSFRVNPSGRLETQEGYAVLNPSGQPIQLDPQLPLEIDKLGEVYQDNALVAQIAVAELQDTSQLQKRAGTYFAVQGVQPGMASTGSVDVHQGKLEAGNTSPAEAAVRLVNVMRQFEMLQRAVQIGSEMNRRAADDVARVGS